MDDLTWMVETEERAERAAARADRRAAWKKLGIWWTKFIFWTGMLCSFAILCGWALAKVFKP